RSAGLDFYRNGHAGRQFNVLIPDADRTSRERNGGRKGQSRSILPRSRGAALRSKRGNRGRFREIWRITQVDGIGRNLANRTIYRAVSRKREGFELQHSLLTHTNKPDVLVHD